MWGWEEIQLVHSLAWQLLEDDCSTQLDRKSKYPFAQSSELPVRPLEKAISPWFTNRGEIWGLYVQEGLDALGVLSGLRRS